jgi:DNA-binding CsgD family transcriptional regulator
MGGRGSGRTAVTEYDREIARLYAEGMSLKEVGRRFGVNPDTVRSALRRMGVPCRPRGSGRKADAGRDREIARLYAGGLTLMQIGRRFGLSVEGVRVALRRLGVPRRPCGSFAVLPPEERRRIASQGSQAAAAKRAAQREAEEGRRK